MKKKPLTIMGALALVEVLGVFTAAPALAQTTTNRATIVKNIDEKGRSPYMQFQARSCPGGGNIICDIVFPPVPAGKRLVIERVSASVIFAPGGVRLASLLAPSNAQFFFPVHPIDTKVAGEPIFVVNDSTLAYFEGGQSPVFHWIFNNGADVPNVSSTISGYLVDLEQ